jgi:hypothetical protein
MFRKKIFLINTGLDGPKVQTIFGGPTTIRPGEHDSSTHKLCLVFKDSRKGIVYLSFR